MTKKATVVKRSAIYKATVIEPDFEGFSAEWSVLCENGSPAEAFSRPDWFRSLADAFKEPVKLIVVRHESGELCAVLPVILRRDSLHGLPVTKLGAAFNLQSQRFDLIHVADESQREPIIDALWHATLSLDWDVFETRLTPAGSWLESLQARAARDGFATGVWKMDGAPFVTLPADSQSEDKIDEYFNAMSKNRRKLLTKNLRLLRELGEVSFHTSRGYDAGLLRKYFELEAQSWKSRAGTDVTSDPRITKLHDDFARASGDRLLIHELKLNGETIAMYIALDFDPHRTLGWKMSFNEDYARFSPGNVLFRDVLAECMRRGSTELDMLSPETYNKSLFASGTRPHAALYIFRRGIYGSLLNRWKFDVVARLREIRDRRKEVQK